MVLVACNKPDPVVPDAAPSCSPALVAPQAGPCATAGFGYPNVLVGAEHTMSRLADVDGDGKPDLISPELAQGVVAIARGRGDATFADPARYPAGSQPVGIDVGDLDSDGDVDVVAVSQASGDDFIYLLRNQGDGTFAAATTLAAPTPRRVFVASIDDDIRPDLVTVSFSGQSVSVLLGTATGFATPITIGVGMQPLTAAIADLDDDGKLDILAVGLSSSLVGTLAILHNTGGGAFVVTTQMFPDQLNDIAVADFDGDGKRDVALATTSSVIVHAGTGTTTLGTASSIPFRVAHGLGVADLDHDSDPDLAVVGWAGLAVLRSSPTGFTSTVTPFELPGPEHVTAGDVDADGITDLVLANAGNGGGLAVLRNPGTGSFTLGTKIDSGELWVVAAGDLDLDGKEDVVRVTADSVVVYLQRAGALVPGFQEPVTGGGSAAIGDLNEDHIPDFVIATQNEMIVFIGQGQGAFAPGVHSPSGSYSSKIELVDLGGGCAPEIVVTHPAAPVGLEGAAAETVGVFRNRGDGTFDAEVTYGAPFTASSTVGDFDGDGIPDLAIASISSITILHGVGDTTFTLLGTVATESAYDLDSADLDGDGKRDLVVATGSSLGTLRGHGDGTFGSMLSIPSLGLYTGNSMFLRDFDGDGHVDVVFVNNGGLGVHHGNTDGTFSPPQVYTMPGLPRLVADLDGDTRLDALVRLDAQDGRGVQIYRVLGTCL